MLRKFFKSELFFVFTESWSRDQVTQRAYWCKKFQKQPHPDKKRKKLNASLMGPFSNFLKAFYFFPATNHDEITTLSGQFLRLLFLLKGMNTVILFWLIIYDEVISHRYKLTFL